MTDRTKTLQSVWDNQFGSVLVKAQTVRHAKLDDLDEEFFRRDKSLPPPRVEVEDRIFTIRLFNSGAAGAPDPS